MKKRILASASLCFLALASCKKRTFNNVSSVKAFGGAVKVEIFDDGSNPKAIATFDDGEIVSHKCTLTIVAEIPGNNAYLCEGVGTRMIANSAFYVLVRRDLMENFAMMRYSFSGHTGVESMSLGCFNDEDQVGGLKMVCSRPSSSVGGDRYLLTKRDDTSGGWNLRAVFGSQTGSCTQKTMDNSFLLNCNAKVNAETRSFLVYQDKQHSVAFEQEGRLVRTYVCDRNNQKEIRCLIEDGD